MSGTEEHSILSLRSHNYSTSLKSEFLPRQFRNFIVWKLKTLSRILNETPQPHKAVIKITNWSMYSYNREAFRFYGKYYLELMLIYTDKCEWFYATNKEGTNFRTMHRHNISTLDINPQNFPLSPITTACQQPPPFVMCPTYCARCHKCKTNIYPMEETFIEAKCENNVHQEDDNLAVTLQKHQKIFPGSVYLSSKVLFTCKMERLKDKIANIVIDE